MRLHKENPEPTFSVNPGFLFKSVLSAWVNATTWAIAEEFEPLPFAIAARYEGNPAKEKPRVKIFTEHIEDPDWKLPINCFFVDGTGKSERIKIDPESLAVTSDSIH